LPLRRPLLFLPDLRKRQKAVRKAALRDSRKTKAKAEKDMERISR
jgi:hypothetical protein